MTRTSLVFGIALAACGGGGDGGGADAAPDMPASTLMDVDPCPGSPDGTVTTDDATFAYSPSGTTISQGQVIKFVTSATHDVKPNTVVTTDVGLNVGFNQTKCLRFTATGMFGFRCSIHGFVGTITVN